MTEDLVTLKVPPEIHKRIRVAAANRGTGITEMAVEMILVGLKVASGSAESPFTHEIKSDPNQDEFAAIVRVLEETTARFKKLAGGNVGRPGKVGGSDRSGAKVGKKAAAR